MRTRLWRSRRVRRGRVSQERYFAKRTIGRSSRFDGLDDLEALEAGMADIEGLVITGIAVRLPEGVRARPGFEVVTRAPAGGGREGGVGQQARSSRKGENNKNR